MRTNAIKQDMAEKKIIGRHFEKQILSNICNEEEARLVAVYGRRRVGKTHLVKYFFEEKFDFFFTGNYETPAKVQLRLFSKALEEYSGNITPPPATWFDAFDQLKAYLISLKKKKTIVFLDELPWMDTPKSGFLTAFSHFWNTWGSTFDGLKLIVCGSATSWMLEKVIGDKGGLYGRSSRSIYLAPFNLAETEEYLKQRKGIVWNRYQIAQAYMILGGIPYYLDMLERGLPFDTNVDNLFFRKGAPLRAEYDFLFRSLFKASGIYKRVVEIIARKNKGMTLKELKEEMKIGDGGQLSVVLENLCHCDFLRKYSSFGKKKNGSVYQLCDLFSLYHLRFVESSSGQDEHYWSNLSDGIKNAWAGYAFEQVCLHHLEQIRKALGISGVLTTDCSWSTPPLVDQDGANWPGAQIDLLLVRADHVISVCEMKFSQSLFSVTRDYSDKIRERNSTFIHHTRTSDAIQNILVTTYGIKDNAYSGFFVNAVTLDNLFV